MEKYQLLEAIGTGSSCIVYRGINKENNTEVAIKIIKLENENENENDNDIYLEIIMTKNLNHRNIVKIYDSLVEDESIWIVLELELNSCLSILKSIFPTGIKDEILLATILKYTLVAIEYCHSHGQIHRDIKAANILINKNGTVKLSDFGAGALLIHDGDRKRIRHSFVGTPCWMAPELINEERERVGYTEKIDIWSFGITILELAFGHAPYHDCTTAKIMKNIRDLPSPSPEYYKTQPNKFSKHFNDITAKCLTKDQNVRSSAKELLKHKFFKQARDEKYIIEHIKKS